MMREGGPDEAARLAYGFRLCTARTPTPAELTTLLASLQRRREEFTEQPESAKKLIATGESPADPALEATDLAAHTSLALLMLNLDETLSKE